MTKTHRNLGILLVLQVLMAALLGWWQWREPASRAGDRKPAGADLDRERPQTR